MFEIKKSINRITIMLYMFELKKSINRITIIKLHFSAFLKNPQ